MKGVECIYCGHKAARSRKRTNDFKCDHCDKTFTQGQLDEFLDRKAAAAQEDAEVRAAIRKEAQRSKAIAGFRERLLDAARELEPPASEVLFPPAGGALAATLAAVGCWLLLSHEPWLLFGIEAVVIVLVAALVGFLVLKFSFHKVSLKLSEVAEMDEAKLQDAAVLSKLVSIVSDFVPPEYASLLPIEARNVNVIPPRPETVPMLRRANSATRDQRLAVMAPRREAEFPSDVMTLLDQAETHPDDILTVIRTFIEAKKSIREQPSQQLSQIHEVYETDIRYVWPPSSGKDSGGEIKPFDQLPVADKMRVMADYRPQVVGRSVAAREIMAEQFRRMYGLPEKLSVIMGDLVLLNERRKRKAGVVPNAPPGDGRSPDDASS